MKRLCGIIAGVALGLVSLGATAQTAAAGDPASMARSLAETTALRDALVKKLRGEGLTCPIAVPEIVVEDVPSYGQYNPKTNILRTSDWTVLRPNEKAFYQQLAGPGADETKVRALFEVAAHKWIFVHEVGHWWQTCMGKFGKQSNYKTEYDANRVTLAYWREVDPAGVVSVMVPVFQSVVDHMPSPLPAGATEQVYFDENYQKLGPTQGYAWFMSRMIVQAEAVKPEPTFKQVMLEIKE